MSECSSVLNGDVEIVEINKQLEEYAKLDAEAEEIEEEDKVYRKKIVK